MAGREIFKVGIRFIDPCRYCRSLGSGSLGSGMHIDLTKCRARSPNELLRVMGASVPTYLNRELFELSPNVGLVPRTSF